VAPGAPTQSLLGAINPDVLRLKQIVLFKSLLVSFKLGGQKASNALISPTGVNLFPPTATAIVLVRAVQSLAARPNTHQVGHRYQVQASQHPFTLAL
jgi:hypothetical protein